MMPAALDLLAALGRWERERRDLVLGAALLGRHRAPMLGQPRLRYLAVVSTELEYAILGPQVLP